MEVIIEGKFPLEAVEVIRENYPDYQWSRGLSQQIMIGITDKEQSEIEKEMDNLNGRWFDIEGYILIGEAIND